MGTCALQQGWKRETQSAAKYLKTQRPAIDGIFTQLLQSKKAFAP